MSSRSIDAGRIAAFAALALYAVALVYARDSVPAGLNNDAAEETLRGLLLLDQGRFEPITAIFGIPQETLYLYAEAAVAKFLGATTLAIQLTSWCAALGCVALLVRLSTRLERGLAVWVPLGLALSSVWLFHYARSGLRAVSAPLFLLAFAALLDRAEEEEDGRYAALGAGAVLGLSLYAYTSCRAMAIAFVLHAAVRLWRGGAVRARLAARYAEIAAAALVVSIPNLMAFARAPRDFLLRGGYVLMGGLATAVRHVFWSALLPFHYPDGYRAIASKHHIFDGVSAGLTSSGIDPLPLAIAPVVVAGFAVAWRQRARAGVSFLLWTWLAATLSLGISGPSLTRLLILLPVYLVFAALALAAFLQRLPRAAPAVAVLLVAVAAQGGHAYFTRFAGASQAQSYFSPAATPIGERARTLAEGGERVLCVVAKDANVVHYLTYEDTERVRVVEFFRRPPDPAALQLAQFGPDVLLIERQPTFARLLAAFPSGFRREHPMFDEVRLRAPR